MTGIAFKYAKTNHFKPQIKSKKFTHNLRNCGEKGGESMNCKECRLKKHCSGFRDKEGRCPEWVVNEIKETGKDPRQKGVKA